MRTTIGLLALGLFLLQAFASAEVIQGSVQRIDAANDTLYIRRFDADIDKNGKLPREFELKVGREAKLKNIASLQDLENGSPVKVDVKQNKNLGVWEAKSVELNEDARI